MAGRLEDVCRDLDAPIQPGEFTDDINPEAATKLFKAIVLNMLEDACAELPEVPRGCAPEDWEQSPRSKKSRDEAWSNFVEARQARRREMQRSQDESRSILLSRGRDLEILCGLAGWDADHIRSKSEKLAANGWSSRRKMEAA